MKKDQKKKKEVPDKIKKLDEMKNAHVVLEKNSNIAMVQFNFS